MATGRQPARGSGATSAGQWCRQVRTGRGPAGRFAREEARAMLDVRKPVNHCKEILLGGGMGCTERSVLALDGHREIIIVGFIFTVFVLVHDGGV